MALVGTSSIKFGVTLKCKNCVSEKLIKSGKTGNGKQRYKCKTCNFKFIIDYSYNAYKPYINGQIVSFTKEGLGIRSTARLLKISTTTLLSRILKISETIKKPVLEKGQKYEMDELCTFVKKKEI